MPAALAWVPVVAGCALIAAGLAPDVPDDLALRPHRGHACALGPTRRLSCWAPRHVRNPMITGVLAILLGEAVLLGSAALLVWFGAFFTVNAIWMPLVEEPGLVERFGDDYRRSLTRAVPRWIPGERHGPATTFERIRDPPTAHR